MATFVLVHGATAGGWVWRTVTQELEKAGHLVYRPTLTGLGERVLGFMTVPLLQAFPAPMSALRRIREKARFMTVSLRSRGGV